MKEVYRLRKGKAELVNSTIPSGYSNLVEKELVKIKRNEPDRAIALNCPSFIKMEEFLRCEIV